MIDNLRAGRRQTDGRGGTRQRADKKQDECVSVSSSSSIRRDSAAPTLSSNQNRGERKKQRYTRVVPEPKRVGHFIRRMSSNVWGYRYVVVCQWTCCYPFPGSHYDCIRSPLHEQDQSASPEKLKKMQG